MLMHYSVGTANDREAQMAQEDDLGAESPTAKNTGPASPKAQVGGSGIRDDVPATIDLPSRLPGTIGEFRIVRELGRGGMGIVYEAEQRNPKRPVALKVVRGGGFVDDTHVRMFRREVQTLARLRHPGIAAIYESGRTDDGQHYFAMELVRGETMREYLKRRDSGRLSPVEVAHRLGLFCRICDAINYAHQRGVIHRDLKPTNILVPREGLAGSGAPGAAPSGTPAPVPDVKVLDFGLARITDSDVAVSTVLTDLGDVMGTLPYMSPEQVRGNPDEIDLRTDVYSLGVVLYEMLTGQLPLELPPSQLPAAVRIIGEEAPRPLTRTWKGARKLDSDLATIVHKALEKEPARRYQSAAAVAEDIQRYLSGQPILARPPSTTYQLRKLVARHKVPFAFATAFMLLVTGFGVTMAVQSRRIAHERDRANREAETARHVSDFLVQLFQVSDPNENRGNTITARELLDKGAVTLERELADQPLLRAQLMHTMGCVYKSLALNDQAKALLEQAVVIRQRELGDDHPDYARSLLQLGDVSGVDGLSHYERALAILERNYGPDHSEVGFALYHLRGWYWVKDRQKTEQILERARRIFEQDPEANWRGVSWCLNDLGVLRHWAKDYPGALDYYQRALAIKEKHLGPDDPDVGVELGNIGDAYMRMGDYAAARPLIERSLRIFQAIYGPDHFVTAVALGNLGELFWRMGDPIKAKPLVEHAVAINERTNDYQLPACLQTLAGIERDLGQPAEAEKLLRRALALRMAAAGADSADVVETLKEYAAFLQSMGRSAEAQALETRVRLIDAGLAKQAGDGL
jgi:serine/threonine protein kinase